MGAVAIVALPPRHQRFRETARIGVRLSRQIFIALWQPPVLISFALVLLLAASAVGVVYASHANRALFNDLGNLQQARDGYQRQWSQLLLEQSALNAQSRIEQLATEEFAMAVPGREDIVIVPVGAPYQRLLSARQLTLSRTKQH